LHHKKGRWLALIAVLLVLCGVGGWFGYRHYSLGVISDKQIIKNINSHLLKNNPTSKQTKNYAKIVKSTTRTLDNAYVKVNPYGTSPLTALMIFSWGFMPTTPTRFKSRLPTKMARRNKKRLPLKQASCLRTCAKLRSRFQRAISPRCRSAITS
jgi:hypothetical protein